MRHRSRKTVEDRRLQYVRIRRYSVFVVFAFVVLLSRLWYLQIALGKEMLADSELNRKRLIRTRAPRGVIYDRNGKVLASSRPQFVVSAVPEELEAHPDAFHTLCGILNLTPEELRKIMKKDRPAQFAPVRIAVDVPVQVVAQISERSMLLPGVTVELDQLRYYPDGALCAHLLGYLGEINERQLKEYAGIYNPGDFVGQAGLEKEYETLLHGADGGKYVEVDARGRTTKILGDEPPTPGATLTLTIDKDVQIAAERVLSGKTGAAVAVNPQTGEVLAMVSQPDFDPNVFVKRVKPEDWNSIVQNKGRPLHNRAVQSAYPPGSTFKPVTGTAALEYKVATPKTGMNCPGGYHLGRLFKRCWRVHGAVNFTTAISQSCDTFFYEMGRRLGIERLSTMGKGFGLGQETGIDLPGEKPGIMPDSAWKIRVRHEKWYPGNTINCAIGQGDVIATPLQMSLVASAVANFGRMYRPQLIRSMHSPDGRPAKHLQPAFARQVPASRAAFSAVREGMRQAVIGPGGTGHVADLKDIHVCAKTGSAEVSKVKKPHGWFICFAPMEKPTIAIACVVEHGGHGSSSAAPVARAMLDVYFHKRKASEIMPGTAHVLGD
jgi:penicillin-binding protein 2